MNHGALQTAIDGFTLHFGAAPQMVASAPGRVNIIGEHTDYHDGFVLPMAISLRAWLASSKRSDGVLALHSSAFNDPVQVKVDDLVSGNPLKGWGAYLAGVAWALKEQGYKDGGLSVYLHSEVPRGGGLSSSAALEVAMAMTVQQHAGIPPRTMDDLKRMARTCQLAENAYVGVPCGIMDQTASACAAAGAAVLIDCRDLSLEHVRISPSLSVVACDSAVRHALAGGQYAQRRQQSERALRLLQQLHPDFVALRDAPLSVLTELTGLCAAAGLDAAETDITIRRARHVITENARVLATLDALPSGDEATLRELLGASHRSLRDDYEVSCPELDALVAAAEAAPGFVAGRMTGGGFGGSTVNLVRKGDEEAFIAEVRRRYPRLGGAWSFHPDAGVKLENT